MNSFESLGNNRYIIPNNVAFSVRMTNCCIELDGIVYQILSGITNKDGVIATVLKLQEFEE